MSKPVIPQQISRTITELENNLGAELVAGSRWLKEHPGRAVAHSLRPYSKPRNADQNARLWWLHGLMAAQLNVKLPDMIAAGLLPKSFRCFTAEAVHEGIFKPKYLGTKPDGTPRSSARLSTMDFAEAMTRYEADMINEGVEIPSEYEPTEDAA
jgi:hypothetical protein